MTVLLCGLETLVCGECREITPQREIGTIKVTVFAMSLNSGSQILACAFEFPGFCYIFTV